jgi:hypothetical protein
VAEAARPQTAREVLAVLVQIFPSFAKDVTDDDLVEWERMSVQDPHAVMIPFTQYFGANLASFSDRQLLALGTFLNRAVEFDDALENAVATCFLEHLRQINGYKTLAPHLSAGAKSRTRA